MSPLITTIANGTATVLETPVLLAASIAAVMVSNPQQKATKSRFDGLDSRTMSDIGFERGAITWMR